MSKLSDRKYYMKKIYFDAGRSIMDNCCKHMKQYINYKLLNKMYFDIQQYSDNKTLFLQDCYGAFITTLCTRLNNEVFYGNDSFTVLDPYYSEKVVCILYIPDKNISIINNICDISNCKACNLYSDSGIKSSLNNRFIAVDFFKKALKDK